MDSFYPCKLSWCEVLSVFDAEWATHIFVGVKKSLQCSLGVFRFNSESRRLFCSRSSTFQKRRQLYFFGTTYGLDISTSSATTLCNSQQIRPKFPKYFSTLSNIFETNKAKVFFYELPSLYELPFQRAAVPKRIESPFLREGGGGKAHF